jgi:hypothetical protein
VGRLSKISAFLFIRAYHRAIEKNLSIQELATELKVTVEYIKYRRAYLEQQLKVKFPSLEHRASPTRKTVELRRMVRACVRTAALRAQSDQE